MSAADHLRCFACGRFTDEVSVDGPTAQEVGQVRRWTAGVLDVNGNDGPCRAAVVCWRCFWKTEPDTWILPEHWAALTPLVPFEKLPALDHGAPNAWDPATYAWPAGT